MANGIRYTSQAVDEYRVDALHMMAHPDARNGSTWPPSYWNRDMTKLLAPDTVAKAVTYDPGDLAETVMMLRDRTVKSSIATSFEVKEQEVTLKSLPDMIEALRGEQIYGEIMRAHTGRMYRTKRSSILSVVPQLAIDGLALQLAECDDLTDGYKSINVVCVRVTRSEKDSELWTFSVPKKDSGRPRAIIKHLLGDGFALEKGLRSFASAAIKPAKANLATHCESFEQRMYRDYLNYIDHSAEVLGVQL